MTIKAQRPELSEAECRTIANKALELRRGKKRRLPNGNVFYEDGTDSAAYNFMMTLADQRRMPIHLQHLESPDNPRTPMLGSSMSRAVMQSVCGSDMLTSRANWGIQSTGVDILHMFLNCLQYLKAYYGLGFVFMFTYHDEIWTLSPEAEKYQAAFCFQVAHLWTWSYFFKRLGFQDIPWNYQFFSSVNVDTSFRKEVDESQATLSNDEQLPDGESLTMVDIINKLS